MAARRPWLGVIADDVTGAADLAGTLVAEGVRTIQTFGPPTRFLDVQDTDCVVVSLKTRTLPAGEAVEQSLVAARRLRALGIQQIYFKYCSTFDSTSEGNIGPVADALRKELVPEGQVTLMAPGTPAIGRTVYQGTLFAGRALLSESSMLHHPLTPMSDSNVVRLLAAQTGTQVGQVDYRTVENGASAVQAELARLGAEGFGYAVADTLDEQHLDVLGAASLDHPLVTGGAGLARGLASARRADMPRPAGAEPMTYPQGTAAVIAGSCSETTRLQISLFAEHRPCFLVDPTSIAEGHDVVSAALRFAGENLSDGPVLIHSSTSPEEVTRTQAQLGMSRAAELTESALADIAEGLVGLGCRRLIVAGGETSGAVVRKLGINVAQVGDQVDPGVPWMKTATEPGLAILLKSGNLGRPRLFLDAWKSLG